MTCSVPRGISGGFSVKAFVFPSQIQPFPTLLFLFLTTWNANIIPGGAATILQQRGEKREDKRPHSQDGGSRKQKSLLSLLSSLGLAQNSTTQGKLIT